MAIDSSKPVILYDGVCGLCNRIVRFILKRDSRDRFRFATLQSEFARGLLHKHGMIADKLESTYLVLDPHQATERALIRSEASIAILRELGGFWHALAGLLAILPCGLSDWGYNLVARYRYRLFGKYDTCPLPDERTRSKFIAL
jgi:predicted DCC family thiol-disulfide oxidoreductase YuxK